jgi:hypothetical protein
MVDTGALTDQATRPVKQDGVFVNIGNTTTGALIITDVRELEAAVRTDEDIMIKYVCATSPRVGYYS